MEKTLTDIADIVNKACDAADVYVLTDVGPLGLTDDDMMRLYMAAWPSEIGKPFNLDNVDNVDETSELCNGPGNVICTTWLHVARMATRGQSANEIGVLLKLSYNIMIFIRTRGDEPELFTTTLRECLRLGQLSGDKDVAQYAGYLKYLYYKEAIPTLTNGELDFVTINHQYYK